MNSRLVVDLWGVVMFMLLLQALPAHGDNKTLPIGSGSKIVIVNDANAGTANQQMRIKLELRVGDLNADGYTDIFVDRRGILSQDGSLQDVFLYQQPDGSFSAHVPTKAEENAALAFPINTVLEPCLGDFNYDGWADLVIENLASVPGLPSESIIVFAPAVPGSSIPANVKRIDQDVLQFTYDIQQAIGNPNHFAENVNVTIVPVFGYTIHCVVPYGDLPVGCTITTFITTYVSGSIGFNPWAADFIYHFNNLRNSLPIDLLGGDEWWGMAQNIYNVYGVYAFGFKSDGSRTETSHSESIPILGTENEFGDLLLQLAASLQQPLPTGSSVPPEEDWVPHGYDFSIPLCSPSNPHCTLENVFCWVRRFNAPRDVVFGDETWDIAQDGETQDLFGDNPITVWVDETNHVLINQTKPGHRLHDEFEISPQCGATDPAEATRCAIVRQSLSVDANGNIIHTVKGQGHNRKVFDKVMNEVLGEAIFAVLANQLLRAVNLIGDCASWEHPE